MWLAQENGKLQPKNMALMTGLPEGAFRSESYRLYALIFICGFLKPFFRHF